MQSPDGPDSEKLLDRALFRRFDDVIPYALPDDALIRETLRRGLSHFVDADLDWDAAIQAAQGLSQADLLRACEDALKEYLLEDHRSVTQELIIRALGSRREIHRQVEFGP